MLIKVNELFYDNQEEKWAHKNILVNTDNINSIDPNGGNTLIKFCNGESIPVSESIDEIAEIQYKWLNPKGAK